MARNNRRFITLLVPIFILFSVTASGCGASKSMASHEPDVTSMIRIVPMASMVDMPSVVKAAPVVVRQSYQFAVANPDVLQHVACYCGCGKMGHKSNYMCYVKNAEGGKVIYDNHALGCSICVDTTQDAMRLYKDGKSIKEIRDYVDAAYSKYGPTNLSE